MWGDYPSCQRMPRSRVGRPLDELPERSRQILGEVSLHGRDAEALFCSQRRTNMSTWRSKYGMKRCNGFPDCRPQAFWEKIPLPDANWKSLATRTQILFPCCQKLCLTVQHVSLIVSRSARAREEAFMHWASSSSRRSHALQEHSFLTVTQAFGDVTLQARP